MPQPDPAFEKGLPSSPYAERLVLGSVLIKDTAFISVSATLAIEDFSLDKHRIIFRRMHDLAERGERIDRITLVNELMKHSELEAVDGLSYIASLDEGLPEILNLESYIGIVKEKAVLRDLINMSQETIHRCMMGNEDPDRILASAEERLLKLGEDRAKDDLVSVSAVINSVPGGVNAFLDPSRRLSGVGTGFKKFDEMTGGLRGGELFILAARPAMGKTALALNIAQNVAVKSGKAVAIFSLEMSKDSLLTRLICARARVDQQRFRAGFLRQDERMLLQEAAMDLIEAPIFIDDTSSSTLMDINAKLRKLRAQNDLGLCVVDYLQLMPTPSSRNSNANRTQEVGILSRGMKLLAKDLNIPMLVLSQLSRAPETRPGDHRPQLSDLRESGSIEQDADIVAFIFRPEVYNPDRADLQGVAELIIAKQRNGPTGKIRLTYLKQFTKFENYAEDLEPEPAAG